MQNNRHGTTAGTGIGENIGHCSGACLTYQTRFTNGQGSENQTMRSTAEEPANQDNEEIKVGKESVLKKMLIRDIVRHMRIA